MTNQGNKETAPPLPAGPAAPSEPLLDRDGAFRYALALMTNRLDVEAPTNRAAIQQHIAALHDAAAALRESEARCRQLQDENERLSGLLGNTAFADAQQPAPRREDK